MCPERQLLSVYFDGEMPSPWKEKMESHIAECPRCAKTLEEYGNLSIKPDMEEEARLSAAKERIWQTLEPSFNTEPDQFVRRMPSQSRGVWQRRVSIPLPAAAAAVILFIALALLWLLRSTGTRETADMTIASETDFEMPGFIPTDMESVLQYLSGGDNGEVLILHLPEGRNYNNYGGPAIIKAADYNTRQTSSQPGQRRQ